MKKLLFLATFSFLFVQFVQAVVLPQADFAKEVVLCERASNSQAQIVFGNGGNLSNLNLLTNQQVEFVNGYGVMVMVDMTVVSSTIVGSTLSADFSTSTNLSGLTTVSGQKLEFVHAITGVLTFVDFIVIDEVLH